MTYDAADKADRADLYIERLKSYVRQMEVFNNTDTDSGRRMALTNAYAALADLNLLIDELDDGEELDDVRD